MRFGALLPHAGHAADPDALVAVASAAERHGFTSVWVGDHVLLPASTSDYPYAEGGRYPMGADRPFLEDIEKRLQDAEHEVLSLPDALDGVLECSDASADDQ